MHKKIQIRSSKSIALVLLASLMVFSITQFVNAQNVEGKLVVAPTEEFLDLMKEDPDMAGERLEEGIRIVNESEKTVRIRLFASAVVGGEIHHKYLSEKEVKIGAGENISLTSPGEEFFPDFKWISGMNWVPRRIWEPNPEMYSEGFLVKSTGNNPFLNGVLKEELISYGEASHILYLVALPTGGSDSNKRIPTVPLVIGGPHAKVPGNQWVTVDKRK